MKIRAIVVMNVPATWNLDTIKTEVREALENIDVENFETVGEVVVDRIDLEVL